LGHLWVYSIKILWKERQNIEKFDFSEVSNEIMSNGRPFYFSSKSDTCRENKQFNAKFSDLGSD